MEKSSKFLLFAIGASLLAHGLVFAPKWSLKRPASQDIHTPSAFRIDSIQVTAEKIPAKDGNNKIAPKKRTGAKSIKGKENSQAVYLAYVREEIVSRQGFPFAAKRLGASGKYRLNLVIKKDGSFDYSAKELSGNKFFRQEIERMFEAIGRFKAPPASADSAIVVEFDLEFKR